MNKRTHLLIAICAFSVLLALNSACSKSDIKWVYYDETRCAHPWTYTNNKEILKDNIVEYCKTQGVTIYDIEIFTVQDPETCGECTCKTGKQYKAKIAENSLSKARDIGFYEK